MMSVMTAPLRTATREATETRLRDGSVVVIREIEPSDAAALVRFHEALSHDTIRMRYFSAHPHLSAVETTRLTTVDHRDRQAYVALVGDDIIGVGRYERNGATDEAEVAFVIADAWQGRGLGSILLARLAEHARACGLRRLTASTLADNRAMLKVFLHSGLPLQKSMSSGIVDVTMTLPG
jgi:RimJ/RimL family protein N-acetyltransferase